MSHAICHIGPPNEEEAQSANKGKSTHDDLEECLVKIELKEKWPEQAAKDLTALVDRPEVAKVKAFTVVSSTVWKVFTLGHPEDRSAKTIENGWEEKKCFH